MTAEEMTASVLLSARALGCTCDVEIEVRRLADGVYDAKVAHDDWCPLLADGEFSSITAVVTPKPPIWPQI